jgi:MinD-like ATPase involved in chromosome partitioning or flagellar assembly
MTIIAVGSVTGSPGVTRFVLGLAAAWSDPTRRRVVVEADADGGLLGAELGIGVEPGLMALALAARGGGLTADDLVERGAGAVGDWYVVPAPPSAEQTSSALAHAAGSLAAVMQADDSNPDGPVWLVDAGRLSTRSPAMPFARAAAHVVLVTRGTFPLLQLLPHRIDALRSDGCVVSVVVVEPMSWSPGEVAEFVGADLVTVLPHVSARASGVAAMRSSAWRPWWRRVEDAAAYLAAATADLPVVAS